MKRKIKMIVISCISLIFCGIASAQIPTSNTATLGTFLGQYFDHIGKDIPDSYQYIQLQFKGIDQQSDLHDDLQKAVYLDMIENTPMHINADAPMTQAAIAHMIQTHFGTTIDYKKDTIATNDYTEQIIQRLPDYKKHYCGNTQYITLDLSEYKITSDEKFPILNDVYTRLTSEYYDHSSIEPNQLLYGAIQGLAESIDDPYTVFFPPSDSENYNTFFDGQYEGIGALIEKTDKGIQVVSPFAGSPAEKAGVEPGDVITHVDGKSVVGMNENQAVLLIKGPAGTDVELTILRDEQTKQIIVTRDAITMDYVKYESLDADTFYIDVDAFANDTTKEMREAIQALNQTNATKLIIDLRNNPGGLLNGANEMLSFFLEEGTESFTIKTVDQAIPYTVPYNKTQAKDIEIIILINNGSASASEIVAQVLRDHGLATLVGIQSFGKGSGQTLYDYPQGESFKVTNFRRYSTKTMESIDKVGLEPNVVIQNNENTNKDEQLEYAATTSLGK